MSVNTAAEQLIEAEEIEEGGAYSPTETLCVGMARLGQKDQCIIAGTLEELKEQDFGEPLHCMMICGEVHDLELEFLKKFMVEGSKFKANDHVLQGAAAAAAAKAAKVPEDDNEE